MPIRWGIIGAGNYASNVTALALTSATNTELVAICDINMEVTKGLAVKYSVERTYDSVEKILKDPDLDVVYIATPHSLHARQTIRAAEAGKHVLCEKPMTLTVSDAEQMIEACDKNKVKLGVSFPERYQPADIEARRYAQSGTAGKIDVAHAQFCRGFSRGAWRGWRNNPDIAGAGALYAIAVHPIDLLRFLLDSEVEEVRALTDEEPPRYPVDDMVYVIIKFDNGTHGMVLAGILAPRLDTNVVLYGNKAKITCRDTIWGPLLNNLGELLVDGESVNLRMTFPTDTPLPFRMIREIEAFNKWIEDDTEPYISGSNGLQMVKIANAILESSHHGKAVKI